VSAGKQPSLSERVRHRFIETNGVHLHVVEHGPEDGPLLILLHGFPEFWQGWQHQIDSFADAGYRVMVPDQRGYNLSDKPGRIGDYRVDRLAEDVVGLIDAAERKKALIAGHDWGGVVAWWPGMWHPERVERLAILNVPHPQVMREHLKSNRAQRRRSWYVFFFQLPWLPESRFRKQNFEFGRRALQATSRPGTFSDEQIEVYREAWRRPGAVRGMIHWYRAALRKPSDRPREQRVRVPTLVLWGARDRFLGQEMVAPSLEFCDDGRLVMLDEATHWLQHEEPQRINGLLQEFFAAGHTGAS